MDTILNQLKIILWVIKNSKYKILYINMVISILTFMLLTTILTLFFVIQAYKYTPVANQYKSLITGRLTREKIENIVNVIYKDHLDPNISMFIGGLTKQYPRRNVNLNVICHDIYVCKMILKPFFPKQEYVYQIGNWKTTNISNTQHFNLKMDAVISKNDIKSSFAFFEKIIIEANLNNNFIYLNRNEIIHKIPELKFFFEFDQTQNSEYISILFIPVPKHLNISEDWIYVAFVNGKQVYNVSDKNSNLIKDIASAVSQFSWY